MGFFDKVRSFASGVRAAVNRNDGGRGFSQGYNDEEEKRRQRAAAAAQAAQLRQAQQPRQSPQTPQNPQAPQGQIPNVLKPQTAPLLPVIKQPTVTAPRVEAPRVNVADMVSRIKAAQKPGVQDRNNYYQEDLDKLNAEIKKGARGDSKLVAGLIQSLENRKKELQTGVATPDKRSTVARIGEEARRTGTGIGLRGVRSATGWLQAGAGVADSLGKSEGTSRLSKKTHEFAKSVDETARAENATGAYKASALPIEIAPFILGGGVAKTAATAIPYIGKGGKAGSEILRKMVEARTKGLAGKGNTGRVSADAIRSSLSTGNLAGEGLFTTKLIGEDVARGNDITPERVAVDVLTGAGGNLGASFLGAGGREALRRLRGQPVSQLGEEAVGGTAASAAVKEGGEIIRPWYEAQQQPNIDDMRDARELGANPQFGKKEVSQAELDYQKQNRDERANAADEFSQPSYEKNLQDNPMVRAVNEAKAMGLNVNLPNHRQAIIRRMRQIEAEQAASPAGKAEAQVNQLEEGISANQADTTQAEQAISTAGAEADTPVATAERTQQAAAAAANAPATSAGDIRAANAITDQAKQVDRPLGDVDYETGRQELERTAGNRTLEDITGEKNRIPRIPSGANKVPDAAADATTNTIGNLVGKASRSNNPVINKIGQLFYGLNQKATLTGSEKTLVEQLLGRQGGQGKLMQDLEGKLNEPLTQLDEANQAAAKERVFDAMSNITDGRKFGRQDLIDQGKAIIDSFTPVERAYFDNIRELNILRNDMNRGGMSDEVLEQGSDGMHMPRIYDMEAFYKEFTPDDIATYAASRNKTLDLDPNKRRKEIDEISEGLREQMLRDPAQATLIRAEIALHNRAIREYANKVAQIDGAISNGNTRGYLPVPNNPRYGELAGRYVRKDLADKMLSGADRFESQGYQKVAEVLDWYQNTAMGKLEGYLRQTLTVFNPATRMGNRGANITMSQLAGFNVPEMALRQQHYVKTLGEGGDDMTRLAQSYGAIDNGAALARFSGVNQASRDSWAGRRQESYQNVDDGAKVAMFEWQLKKNGGDPVAAARFVNRALPNIGNSGEIYRFFSRLPILGVPFRAIQPEVYRALASNATRHSAPFLTAMAAYSTFQNWTWDEIDPEERKQIEERFGAGRTPFAKANEFIESKTGIQSSKVLPSTWSFNAGRMAKAAGLNDSNAIMDTDPRRLMGMYSLNTSESAAGGALDEVKKISPAQIPIKLVDGKIAFQPQEVVGSRVGQPIAQVLMDRDFRGKSIQDPEGKFYDPITGEAQQKFVNPDTLQPEGKSDFGRAMQSLARSWLPQLNDLSNVKDAQEGRETFYGQDMNVPQAIGRLFGLKGEEFNADKLKDMRDTNAYFEERKQIDAEAVNMSPGAAEAYKRASGYYKLREEVPNEFEPGDMRNKKAPVYNYTEDKWKDISQNPELYDLLKNKKEREAARQGSPISPEFDNRLSEGFRKQLVQNKSAAPGDNAELDQRMYSHPEWDTYMAVKKEYKEKAKKYYPQSGEDDYTDELVRHNNAKFPDKPPAKKAYDDAYEQYRQGKGAKPAFNEQVEAAKEQYEQSKWNWTNNERLKRGLPPIPKDMWDNVTFGYEDDEEKVYKELKYGKGFGGGGYGGGGGGKGDYQNDFGKMSYITNLAGSGDGVPVAPRAKKFQLNTAAIQAATKVGKGSGRKVTLKS